MASMASRRISQETFDETVRENMEEFEMTRDEALADAVSQFKSQGVDLAAIDTSGSEERRAERAALAKSFEVLAEACRGGVATADIVAALAAVDQSVTAVAKKRAKAARYAALAAGALGSMSRIVLGCVDAKTAPTAPRCVNLKVARAAASTLRHCFLNDAETRDAARDQRTVDCCVALLKAVAAAARERSLAAAKNHQDEDQLLVAAMELCATICRANETNKAAVAKSTGAVEGVVTALAAVTEDAACAEACCQAIISLTSADDLRSATSCTFDNAKLFVTHGALKHLVRSLNFFQGGLFDAALARVLDALRQLAKGDDCVKVLRKAKILDVLKTVLLRGAMDARVVALLRNLASSDDAKDDMCNHGTLQILVAAVHNGGRDDPPLAEHGLATLAQMALRRPQNAAKIVDLDGIDLVISMMHRHPQHVNLQRQGCLALRNLVARSQEELVPKLLDAGAELALRNAAKASQQNVDVAYAALRDLGIDAAIQAFEADEATGTVKVVQKETFGGGHASNFRAIFDESCDVDKAIAKVDALVDQHTKLTNFAVM